MYCSPSSMQVIGEPLCGAGMNSDPPGQFDPPPAPGRDSVAGGPSHRLTTGGVKIGPIV